jgi:hypothetical protein
MIGVPGTAAAHAFGSRYDLPLPLTFYLVGAGVVVALSFLIVAVFVHQHAEESESWRFDLLKLAVLRPLGHPLVLGLLRVLSVAVFVLLLAFGFFGNPDPFKNLSPIFVWVLWWVGMAFVSAALGNLWMLISPWSIVARWAGAVTGAGRRPRPYPACLGKWPALILFFVFAWMELISDFGEQPSTLATLIVVYSLITWTGMAVYGRETWEENGETFAIIFGIFARFAPTRGDDGRWELRIPAVGLLQTKPVGLSMVCFVLMLLTTVTFDGILETPLWVAFLDWVAENQTLRAPLIALQDSGFDLIKVVKTTALVAFPLFFLAVFLVFSRLITLFGGGGVSLGDATGYFVLSLVPIAIAYHLSHYLTYLLIAGQYAIPLASDPFGFGWDLFGTAGYRIDVGIIGAKATWYVAVTSIVVAHVLAVFIAHVMALRVFASRRQALISQAPMLVLMVAYTMVGLWILSQPIIA